MVLGYMEKGIFCIFHGIELTQLQHDIILVQIYQVSEVQLVQGTDYLGTKKGAIFGHKTGCGQDVRTMKGLIHWLPRLPVRITLRGLDWHSVSEMMAQQPHASCLTRNLQRRQRLITASQLGAIGRAQLRRNFE